MGSTAARTLGLLLASVLIGSTPASAQYFGQNKVQYRQFDFRVLSTEHFDVHYYEEEAEAAQLAARMAERWYSRSPPCCATRSPVASL
jgi:hypothetical protein